MAPRSRSFAPGEFVVASRDGEQRVGEVVGVMHTQVGDLYEVALEDVTFKGVWADELAPATPEALQATLGWLALDPEFASVVAQGGREAARRAELRRAYAASLHDALARTEAAEEEVAGACHTTGDVVAVRDGECVSVGLVQGVRRREGQEQVVVEALGEVRSIAAADVLVLDELAGGTGAFDLHARARLVAAGHEDDEDFVGTIVSACRADGTWSYALAFDDGDIMEELLAQDLVGL